jgi:hypothetical protein
VAGSCEHSNETSVSIKVGEFINWLSDYQLINDHVLCTWIIVFVSFPLTINHWVEEYVLKVIRVPKKCIPSLFNNRLVM